MHARLLTVLRDECRGIDDVMVSGDMNAVMSGMLDRSPQRAGPSPLHAFVDDCGLIDAWREKNANAREYSFESIPQGSRSRIDYVLV